MADDIYNLQDEITSNFSKSLYVSDHFRDRILGLTSLYPVDAFEKSYKKIIRELNRKLDLFDLTSKIIEPVDGGLRPTDLTNFFNQSVIPSGFTVGFSVRALVPGNPKIMRLRASPGGHIQHSRYRDFLASEMTFDDIMNFRGGTLGDGTVLSVSKWYDQSGNGNDLLGEAVSSEPRLDIVAPTISNPGEFEDALSGIKFNGTTSYLRFLRPETVNVKDQPVSSFNVVKLQTPFNLNRHIYGTNTNRGLAALTNRAKYYFSARSIQPFVNTSRFPTATQVLFSAIHDGTTNNPNVTMSYNGGAIVSTAPHQGSPNVSTHIHTVGRRKDYATASNYFSGHMRELIIYTSDKTSQRSAIESNIMNHFNIS